MNFDIRPDERRRGTTDGQTTPLQIMVLPQLSVVNYEHTRNCKVQYTRVTSPQPELASGDMIGLRFPFTGNFEKQKLGCSVKMPRPGHT